MKPFCILFCLWSFAVSAATNTVLTTTTNRTLAISALGAQMVSSNTAASVRTLLNVTNATGVEALLSGTNTFSGTNNFTGTVIITNAASTISGNGAGLTNLSFTANNIGVRLLWSSPTNIYIPRMYPADGVTTLAFTNNGLVNTATQWMTFTIPPLLGSNSSIVFSALRQTTNANQFNGNMAVYIGPNTNYVGYLQPFLTSFNIQQNLNFTAVLANCGSFTNQITSAFSPASSLVTNYFDSTVSNTVYLGFFLNGVTGYRSNDVLIGFCAQEVYRP